MTCRLHDTASRRLDNGQMWALPLTVASIAASATPDSAATTRRGGARPPGGLRHAPAGRRTGNRLREDGRHAVYSFEGVTPTVHTGAARRGDPTRCGGDGCTGPGEEAADRGRQGVGAQQPVDLRRTGPPARRRHHGSHHARSRPPLTALGVSPRERRGSPASSAQSRQPSLVSPVSSAQSRQPPVQVRALAPQLLQPQLADRQRAVNRLAVARAVSLQAFRRSGGRSVVHQLRPSGSSRLVPQFPAERRSAEQLAELRGGGEYPGFGLVQAQVRQEPPVSHGKRERTFDVLDPYERIGCRPVGHAGRIGWEAIVVQQGGDHIEAAVSQQPPDLTLQLRPATDTAAVRAGCGRPPGDHDGTRDAPSVRCQMGLEEVERDGLLGLTFDEQVDPANPHQDVCSGAGLPPIRFFSHSSPSEYSANQSCNSSASGRLNTDAPSRRSTTTRSASSNWFMSVTDWVATTTFRSLAAERNIPASWTMAYGCSPSSGSSNTTSRGSSGESSSVARQMKRSVPSESWFAENTTSESTCRQRNRIRSSVVGRRTKSRKNGATCRTAPTMRRYAGSCSVCSRYRKAARLPASDRRLRLSATGLCCFTGASRLVSWKWKTRQPPRSLTMYDATDGRSRSSTTSCNRVSRCPRPIDLSHALA